MSMMEQKAGTAAAHFTVLLSLDLALPPATRRSTKALRRDACASDGALGIHAVVTTACCPIMLSQVRQPSSLSVKGVIVRKSIFYYGLW